MEKTVTAQLRANGIFPQSQNPVATQRLGPENTQSDKYYETQSERITLQSTEDALVKFLYDVGNDPAMIRVRELVLAPADNNRFKLNATITLIADYQKTAPKSPAGKPVLTEKPAVQAPKPAPQATGARATPTNGSQAPARRGSAPLSGPPSPGATPPPARSTPAFPAFPTLPARPSRTTNGNKLD